MAIGRPRNQAREQFWRDALERLRSSGQTAAAFCAGQELNPKQLYVWKGIIERRDNPAATPAKRSATPAMAFSPVRVELEPRMPGDSQSITIHLRGGRVMHLPPALSIERVAALAQLLEGGAA